MWVDIFCIVIHLLTREKVVFAMVHNAHKKNIDNDLEWHDINLVNLNNPSVIKEMGQIWPHLPNPMLITNWYCIHHFALFLNSILSSTILIMKDLFSSPMSYVLWDSCGGEHVLFEWEKS